MQDFSASPREMFASFWRNRSLIYALSKREVVGRYKGSYLGILWSFFNPLLMLVVYTFVFSEIFKSKWNIESDSKIEFALVLFVGLIVFNFFSECVGKASTLILYNPNYVKKVIFPLEILPMISIGSALFHFLISLFVWFIFYFFFVGIPSPTVLLLPLALLPLMLLTLGISLVACSLGVYLRDITQIIGVLLTALMFLTPVFYPSSALPMQYQKIMMFNLLAPAIEITRKILFWDEMPDLFSYSIYLVVTAVIAFMGFAWFQKTRAGFADVL
jgi:lipopolysaccharide transport system permease protein